MERRLNLEMGDIECIFIKIFQNKRRKFYCGINVCPLPPDMQTPNIYIRISIFCATILPKEAIILGDFKELKDILSLLGYKQLIKQPMPMSNDCCVTHSSY